MNEPFDIVKFFEESQKDIMNNYDKYLQEFGQEMLDKVIKQNTDFIEERKNLK